MTITLLHEDAEHDKQTVQLSLKAEEDYYHKDVELTYAMISKAWVNLARIKKLAYGEDGRPEEQEAIALNTKEMDTLVEAWTAFKAGIEAKKQAELNRRAALVAEAVALAESVKTELDALNIQIAPQENGWNDGWYDVNVPGAGFERNVHINGLKHRVQEAIEHIDDHIRHLEGETRRADYETRYHEETRVEHAAQIAAWRKVRPISVEAEPVASAFE